MNKYTLQFRNSVIESNYRKQTAENVQLKTFQFCSVFYLLYCSYSLGVNICNYDEIKIIVRTVCIATLFISGLIVRKWNQRIDQGLLVLNLTITIFEWERDDSYDKFNYYLYGNNSMLIHTFILFTQRFKYALFTNLSLLALRLTITAQYTNIMYMQLILGIISSFTFIYILYKSEKFSRSSFLSTLKDNSWGKKQNYVELILPLIISKPFLMFSFDELNLTYDLKIMNKMHFPFEQSNTVISFLREAQFINSTLQDYFYNNISKNNQEIKQTFIEEIQIKYRGKKIQILFSGCQLAEYTYFLVLQSESKEAQLLDIKFKTQHNRYFQFFCNHVKQTCKLLKRGLVQICLSIKRNPDEIAIMKSMNLLINMLISHRESLILHNNQPLLSEKINISRILSRMVKYFSSLSFQLQITDSQVIVTALKPYLLGFLYEIFKTLDRSKKYCIKCEQNNTKTSLIFIGLQRLPQTQLFILSESILMRHTLQEDACKNSNILAFVFIFNTEPNDSFLRIQQNYFIPYE